MDKLTKEVYRRVYSELVGALKSDFPRLLSAEQVEFVEQNWRRRLEESKIFLNDVESPAFAAIRLINQSISFVKAPLLLNGVAVVAPDCAPARPRAEEPRRAAEELPAIREEPEPPARRIEISLNLQREEERSAASAPLSADDDGLFGEARAPPAPRAELTSARIVEEERERLLMLQRVEQAIRRKDEEELNRELEDDAEEPLNSQDDAGEQRSEIPTGKNLLLAYFDKAGRKKDKRKLSFKSCVLRIGSMEVLLPYAKGDFLWVANRRCQR